MPCAVYISLVPAKEGGTGPSANCGRACRRELLLARGPRSGRSNRRVFRRLIALLNRALDRPGAFCRQPGQACERYPKNSEALHARHGYVVQLSISATAPKHEPHGNCGVLACEDQYRRSLVAAGAAAIRRGDPKPVSALGGSGSDSLYGSHFDKFAAGIRHGKRFASLA